MRGRRRRGNAATIASARGLGSRRPRKSHTRKKKRTTARRCMVRCAFRVLVETISGLSTAHGHSRCRDSPRQRDLRSPRLLGAGVIISYRRKVGQLGAGPSSRRRTGTAPRGEAMNVPGDGRGPVPSAGVTLAPGTGPGPGGHQPLRHAPGMHQGIDAGLVDVCHRLQVEHHPVRTILEAGFKCARTRAAPSASRVPASSTWIVDPLRRISTDSGCGKAFVRFQRPLPEWRPPRLPGGRSLRNDYNQA